jgi:hypothetical protein
MRNAGTYIGTILAVLAGFFANAIQNYLSDRRKLRHRWDDKAFEIFASYSANARSLRDAAARIAELQRSKPGSSELDTAITEFTTLHATFRADFERIAIVGSLDVIERARDIRRTAYKLRELAKEGKEPYGPDWLPFSDRMVEEQRSFYSAVRRQLKIPEGQETGPGTRP